ncbi:hypothetical protein JTE90_028703 [Oedothorax gibbosus]|uniref:Uncharacterized protein n=1 Tax=Oedothorax gibbosus TaxID=931172 RepID=A0AAV6U4X0_9ARAC|nr:hypothetical protein JTE90_028703 [Oedothorax gibbosus]
MTAVNCYHVNLKGSCQETKQPNDEGISISEVVLGNIKKIMELEISSLKSRVAQLEAQSNEYFHMRLQKDVMCNKISKLQAEITLKQKKIRKLKSKTAKNRKSMSEKTSSLERMEKHLKKIWSLLLVFGDKLKRNGLLTTEERTGIRTEYEEWFSLLVSLNNRNSEEIFTKLNDLPVGLLEVLNDSECSSQNNNSQTYTSNVNQEQSSISVKSNKELISEHSHGSYACLSPQSSISSEINSTNCDEMQSKDHNITVSQTLTVEDFITNDDAFDDELWKLNSGSSAISNNEQIKIESDHSSFKSSYHLKDLSDTESCDKKNPDLVTDQQCAERNNNQEVNKNDDFTSNNIPNNTINALHTYLQTSHNENCTLNPGNVNTPFSSFHTNITDNDIISNDKNVDSNCETDKPKSDFSNIQPSSSKISKSIIKETKSSKRKISKLNKFKLKVIKGNKFGKSRIHPLLQKANQCTNTRNLKLPFHSTPLSNRSLEIDCNSEPKEKPWSQSESVVNNPNQNKRTILIPGPPLKIMKESPLFKDLESQEISHSYQKESVPIDSAMRSKEFVSCTLQPAKKPKLVLRKEISDVAPVRIRGRTLLNRGLLRTKNTELEDDDTPINPCPEEVNKVGQVCDSEHGSTVNAQIPECDFFPENQQKIRLEHKRILTKETSKSISKSRDHAELCKDPNTTEIQISLPSNTSTNFENNSKIVLKDLLKKAESSQKDPIQDSTFKNLSLQKYFKSKRRETNRNRFNVSSFNTFKKGISKFTKHKTIVVNSKRSVKIMGRLTKSKAMKDSVIGMETSCEQDIQIKSDSNETSVRITPEVVSNKSIKMLDTSFENGKKDSPDLTSKTACTAVANSESISSKENIFSVPLIEDDHTQPAIQINSVCKASSVTEKDIVHNGKSTNSLFKSISTINDTDLKKPQDIKEDQNLFLERKNNSSSKKEEVDYSIENYSSADDSVCDYPLVIDEDFGVDQELVEKKKEFQYQQIELKHDKLENTHEFCQNESTSDLICRNVSEDIIKDNSNSNTLGTDSSLLINDNLGGGEDCRNSEKISKTPQENNQTITSECGSVINASLNQHNESSLCRVLTAICKEKGDQRKPVFLCGDLLKRKQDFAPYLIASVASIWKELFQIDSNMPAEECLFHSCVLYGATRRTSRKLHDCFWKSSTEFILKHFTALPLRDVKLSIQMLQQIIQDRCEDESWDNQYLSSALIILASFENCDWIERHLLTEFIISNMNKYGKISLNPNAFDMFCNMYVETILLRPGNPLDTILTCFVNNSTREDAHFVKATAALALMRFVLKKNRKLPPFLNDWFENNKNNSEVIKIKSYYETLTLYVNHYQNNVN